MKIQSLIGMSLLTLILAEGCSYFSSNPLPIDPTDDITSLLTNGNGTVESTKEQDLFQKCRILTAPESVRGWPIVGELKIHFAGSLIWFEIVGGTWPVQDGVVANIWAIVEKDGQIWGGPFDGLKRMNSPKDKSSVCIPDGDKRKYVPAKGEKWHFVASGICRKSKLMKPQQRTAVASIVWE